MEKDNLVYPFENYTADNISTIASRMECVLTNDGHSHRMFIDDLSSSQMTITEKGLFAYIYFLSQEIKLYNKSADILKGADIEVPSVSEYLRNIINNVNVHINKVFNYGEAPSSFSILSSLNHSSNYLYNNMNEKDRICGALNDVVELSMARRGYKYNSDCIVEATEPLKDDVSSVAADIVSNYALDQVNKILK